ncbi:VOC family protein [Candidatus Shapirobacteria bacterium]|nr:VOC family protein [Candidatus Shapirobacteria bacterium]
MFKKMFANCLLVKDFNKSLAFYRDTLGLEINTTDGKFANFKIDNIELAIMEQSQATEMLPMQYMKDGGSVLLCFQVEDVVKAVKNLKSKGVDFIVDTEKTSWGQTVAYFQDPDNNVWEISKL